MNESAIIQMIHDVFPDDEAITPLGIGDDCAFAAQPGHLITTDASVENVHYDLRYVSFADAAYRCLASNLSDIAAMGAHASAWTLALGLKPSMHEDEVRSAIEAMKRCLQDHQSKAWLIGGDVVRSEMSFFSITMWGDCCEGERTWPPVTRRGAKPGDKIVLLGTPGRAAAGFDGLSQGHAIPDTIARAFLRPRALTTLAPKLAERNLLHAMMDTSDGLFTDLPRMLAQSGAGAQIELEAFDKILDEDLNKAARACQKSPSHYKIFGGEDYGLLTAIDAAKVEQVMDLAYLEAIPVSVVGTITLAPGLVWTRNGIPVSLDDFSFKHF